MSLNPLHDIAVRRLRVLPVPRGAGLDPRYKVILLTELAGLGYEPGNTELLDAAGPGLFEDYPALIQTLRALKGGDVDYVPLFSDFPDKVPDDDAHLTRRILAAMCNWMGIFPDGTRLDSGMVVPDWLFDLESFGADPITQHQDRGLFEQGRAKQEAREGDSHVEWVPLTFAYEDTIPERLTGWMRDNLYAKSSIKAALHDDLRALLAALGTEGLDYGRVVFKETRALLMRDRWEAGDEPAVRALATTPVDLLRLFAALTDSDVSLSAPIKYPRLSRPQRRLVLSILEGAPSLAEDLSRHRGLWLALGRGLHPGAKAARFPKTAAAFAALRAGTVNTFNAQTEALIRAGEGGLALAHLKERPGVLARRLHELLRRFPERADEALDTIESSASGMALKNLLVLRWYFASIDQLEHRTVINKRGKIVVLPNNARGALPDRARARLLGILDQGLHDQLAQRESWAGRTAWIDPALADFTVPLQQRAASDGMLTYGRGSWLPVDTERVLRLFIYWKDAIRRTDLDLTVLQFGEDWSYKGHVSYTNLADAGIAHSGDITAAPLGAAEFIDITVGEIEPDVAWLAVQVHHYAGDSFADMDCHAGWMVRDAVDADVKTFDIKTVVNAFDLNGTAAYCVPLAVDIRRGRALLTDLYMAGKAFHNNAEGSFGNVSKACRAIAGFTATRPTLADLAARHVAARGAALTDDRAAADLTFGVSGCDYDAGDVGRILTELL